MPTHKNSKKLNVVNNDDHERYAIAYTFKPGSWQI